MNKWQTKKLGEICNIEIGKTPSRSNIKLWDTEKATDNVWLSIRDLSNAEDRIISDSREYVSDKATTSLSIVKKGTLLVSFKLTLGRLAFAGKNLYTNEAIASLNIKNEKEISREYLYQYLSNFDWDVATKGDVKVKGKTLNKAKLKEIEIVYPLLVEQNRIVKILDETFRKLEKVKQNAEMNLQNSKEFFDSYLSNVFSSTDKRWQEMKLMEIGVTQTGLTPKTSNKLYCGNFIPFITPADIDILGNGSIRYDGRGLSKDGLNAGRKIDKNSILMVCIGATIGKVGFADRDISCNQQINTLTPKDIYYPKIFYYILSTKNFFNKIMQGSSQATLPIINKGKWENILIKFPKSIDEQKSIVKKLDHLSEQTKKLESIYQKKLSAIEELKKSILKKAFSGEL